MPTQEVNGVVVDYKGRLIQYCHETRIRPTPLYRNATRPLGYTQLESYGALRRPRL